MATKEQRAKALSLSKRKKAKAKASSERLLKLVQSEVDKIDPIPGARGETGSQGLTGAPGTMGEKGERGRDGVDGKDGKDGVTTVIHKTELPPDTFMTKEEFEEKVEELRKQTSQGPSSPYVSIKEPVHYRQVTSATYRINNNELKKGINIYGVNYNGDVEISIPPPKIGFIVYINDESGSAGTNNIKVTTVR